MSVAKIAKILKTSKRKVVFSESCTGGLVSGELTKISGVSQINCGSFVTYRPKSKIEWLGVNENTIKKYTAESQQVADEMAMCALTETPEASWSISVVGDVEPKSGQCLIYISIWERTKFGIRIKQGISKELFEKTRVKKLDEAVQYVFKAFEEVLRRKK